MPNFPNVVVRKFKIFSWTSLLNVIDLEAKQRNFFAFSLNFEISSLSDKYANKRTQYLYV